MIRSTRRCLIFALTIGASVGFSIPSWATPYASNVTKTGTSVSFILNEPADSLKYSINGGAAVTLDGTTAGTKMFTLGAATDKFSILAEKNATNGYAIPTGGQIQPTDSGSLGIATNASGLNLISSDTNNNSLYVTPRGVGVSNNPNAPNFGNVYISNGAAGGAGTRVLGDGIYAIHADESDAYGYGDTAQNPNTISDNFPAFSPNSSNSPYRITVSPTGDVYVADFADVNSNAFVLNPNLTTAQNLFVGFNGASPLPAGQNHGSSLSVYTTGSLATNNLVAYTLDEDLTSAQVTGSGSTTDTFSVWKYNIGGGPLPVATMPTKVADGFPNAPLFADMDIGADGKIYLSQNSAAATTARLVVTNPAGTPVYDSLTASQALGSSTDILLNVNQIAVSPDQKWLAGMLNFSDVLVVPLVNGIPDLANRLVVDSGNVNSGRDIAFDAADNIYYVSSGQGLFRILAPGGHTLTTLAWDGSAYSFTSATVAGGVPGDYNNNGVVDAGDYVVWRSSVGQSITLPNDSTPGTVTQADYDVWRAHFGQTAGSGAGVGAGAAVPEPTAAMLLVLGLLATSARRRANLL